jgi:hypothetical protein
MPSWKQVVVLAPCVVYARKAKRIETGDEYEGTHKEG